MAARKKKASRNKKGRRKATAARSSDQPSSRTRPLFPYTTRPAGLRRFLQEVPNRPRPERVDRDLLRAWDLAGGENYTIIRVLKAIGLVDNSNQPTDRYTEFMHAGSGPAALGALIRQVYAPLFQASHAPHRDSDDSLRNLFNIHSTGAPTTMDLQIQTFKALCDYASFDAEAAPPLPPGQQPRTPPPGGATPPPPSGPAPFHIDLHIHLPENKSTRDYQYIIQDIARFIFGREDIGDRDSDG